MSYSEKFKEDCFKLYNSGLKLQQISDKFNGTPHRSVLSGWKKKYNWAERVEKANKQAVAKSDEDATEFKTRLMRIAKAAQIDYLKKIRDKPGDTTYHEADKAIKTELLIRGEATERIEGDISLADMYEQCKKKKEKHGNDA